MTGYDLAMDAHRETPTAQAEDPLWEIKLRRAERDRHLAEIRARKSEIKVEPSPGMKELIDSQDEYRERIKACIRLITGS